eukprot:6209852-Pleurochrysis_carterae.AAC.6
MHTYTNSRTSPSDRTRARAYSLGCTSVKARRGLLAWKWRRWARFDTQTLSMPSPPALGLLGKDFRTCMKLSHVSLWAPKRQRPVCPVSHLQSHGLGLGCGRSSPLWKYITTISCFPAELFSDHARSALAGQELRRGCGGALPARLQQAALRRARDRRPHRVLRR